VRGARCHFIRFVSRTCQFSLSSRPAFERLEDKALQLGCSSIVVAPEASAFDCDSRPGHRHSHLAFPTVDVATALDLSRTPSIVILDARGGVTWRKVGFANGAELAEAEQALAVAASRGDPLPGQ
jgi:hypothetical protein